MNRVRGHCFYRKLVPQHPQIDAEVVYAVRHEYAQTAVDVIARRTRLAFLDVNLSMQALPRVLKLMASELGWDKARVEQERLDALAFLKSMTVEGMDVRQALLAGAASGDVGAAAEEALAERQDIAASDAEIGGEAPCAAADEVIV